MVALRERDDESVDAEDEMGRTPARIAAQQASAEMLHLLLQNGADAEKLDIHGVTPVLMAAWCGFAAVVQTLMAAGANASLRAATSRE